MGWVRSLPVACVIALVLSACAAPRLVKATAPKDPLFVNGVTYFYTLTSLRGPSDPVIQLADMAALLAPRPETVTTHRWEARWPHCRFRKPDSGGTEFFGICRLDNSILVTTDRSDAGLADEQRVVRASLEKFLRKRKVAFRAGGPAEGEFK